MKDGAADFDVAAGHGRVEVFDGDRDVEDVGSAVYFEVDFGANVGVEGFCEGRE